MKKKQKISPFYDDFPHAVVPGIYSKRGVNPVWSSIEIFANLQEANLYVEKCIEAYKYNEGDSGHKFSHLIIMFRTDRKTRNSHTLTGNNLDLFPMLREIIDMRKYPRRLLATQRQVPDFGGGKGEETPKYGTVHINMR